MFVHYLKVEWTFLLFEYTACSLVALHSTMLECHPNPCGPCGPEKLVNLYAVYVLWSTYKQNLYIKFAIWSNITPSTINIHENQLYTWILLKIQVEPLK
jgi:hypothetical protein